jgi:methylthioribose-1-phosphate isomerase
MKSLIYKNKILSLLDQTKLPTQTVRIECQNYIEVANAIKDMIVRGAPAIGVSAAYGVVIGAYDLPSLDKDSFFKELSHICDYIKSTRPTAVNLFWAIDRIYKKAYQNKDKTQEEISEIIEKEAVLMEDEDIKTNELIGKNGSALIHDNWTVLTHCNAGALATCALGTAIGIISTAYKERKNIKVFADETRPYLQGARLTAWELNNSGIPVTLICDNMAGHFMKTGDIDCVIVGADRIALNGDTANKIGTYSLSILANAHSIPFYVAAPISTIDFSLEDGNGIPIEERASSEITHIKGIQIAPAGINVRNPAFDITPSKNISAIVTEKGIIYPPFKENITKLK